MGHAGSEWIPTNTLGPMNSYITERRPFNLADGSNKTVLHQCNVTFVRPDKYPFRCNSGSPPLPQKIPRDAFRTNSIKP